MKSQNKPTSKVSVLQLSPFFAPNVGGVETHLSDLVNLIDNSKIKINNYVLTYQPLVGDKKGKPLEVTNNTEIKRISWFKNVFYKTERYPVLHFLYLTPWLTLQAAIFLRSNWKNIDFVHAHGINAAFGGALLKMLFKKPLIISMHVEFSFPEQGLLTKVSKWVFQKADMILVLTQRSKDELVSLGIIADKIDIYSYWVDQRIFIPKSKDLSKKKLGWPDRRTILFVGRLADEKGVKTLLEAAKSLPEVHFVLAGAGDLNKDVEEASQNQDNVTFLGRIENKDLPIYYSAADMLIIPSLVKTPRPTFEEGIPRVMIEALSCGTPILGTDNGGIKEVIEQGKIGKVIGSDTKSLTSAINYYQKHKSQLSHLQQKCRPFAEDRFSIKQAEIILKSYKKVTQGGKVNRLLLNTADLALKRRSKAILNELNPKDGERILDVGCGDGFYLHLLSNLGVDVELTGIDLDPNGLESARRNLQGNNIKLIQADLMKKLPFPDNYFDKIVMSEVAEHLPDDVYGLKEVFRVLKSGGVMVLSVPNKRYPFLWDPINWLMERLFKSHIKEGFWGGIWNQHLRLYTPRMITVVLNRAGFTVERDYSLTWWCLPFNHHLINLGARLLVQNSNSINNAFKGVNKFQDTPKRSLVTKAYYLIAGAIDKLNDLFPIQDSSVSVVIKASKHRN